MAEIPLDVIQDILPYLAVKDLLRFRCVSMFFQTLIDNPDFIKLHALNSQKSNANVYGIFQVFSSEHLEIINLNNSDDNISQTLMLNPAPQVHDTENIEWQVVGSCNGLVALVSKIYRSKGNATIRIWNPFTRKYKEVMKSCPKIPSCYGWDLSSDDTYGFGYDPSTDDYRLVRIKTSGWGIYLTSKIDVYSLKADSWKEIIVQPLDWESYELLAEFGVLVNNALHWVTFDKGGNKKIVAFHLVSEKLHDVPISRHLGFYFRCTCMKLSVLDGYLTLTVNNSSNTYVWIMKEYGVEESWSQILAFSSSLPDKYYMIPLMCSRGGDKVLLNNNSALIWYDLVSRKFGSNLYEKDVSYRPSLKTFVGSLVSPYITTDEVNFKNSERLRNDETRKGQKGRRGAKKR